MLSGDLAARWCMAALPCALVAHAISSGKPIKGGAWTAYEFLGAERLLEQLTAAGFELKTGDSNGNLKA